MRVRPLGRVLGGLVILAAAPAAVPAASAQPAGAHPAASAQAPGAAAASARTSLTGITLSAPQQAALTALTGRTRGALQALYARAGVRPGALMPPGVRDSVDALIVTNNAALRALLTDDQRPVFEENVRAVAEAHRAARRGSRPGPLARTSVGTSGRPAAAATSAGARP